MADKNNKLPSFRTTRGTFVWPRLGEPDTKFKEEGQYSTKLVQSAEDAAPLLAKLQPLFDEAVKEGKKKYADLPVASRKKLEAKGSGFNTNPLFTPVYDDNEEETGDVSFTFNMTATGVSKKTNKPWSRKPGVFDASGKPMDGKKVWGGSIGLVAFETLPYFNPATGSAGLSLRLQAAQIVELVQGGQKTASGYGFDKEEGYTDEGSALPEETGTNAEGDDSSDF